MAWELLFRNDRQTAPTHTNKKKKQTFKLCITNGMEDKSQAKYNIIIIIVASN